MVLVDTAAIVKFVENEQLFSWSALKHFCEIVKVDNECLSRQELRSWLENLRMDEDTWVGPLHNNAEYMDELYNSTFELFDTNKDGFVDFDEFKAQLRLMMLAIAETLTTTVEMLFDSSSLLRDLPLTLAK